MATTQAPGLARGGDFHRPRRPNPDTIAYLRSLPLDIQVAAEEVSNFLAFENKNRSADDTASSQEQRVDYPQSLAAALSAIDEIRNEIASLAGEEYAAEIIETLAHITAPYSEIAARKLLYGTAGYGLHLATHRYGSHVLQTILELAVTAQHDSDLAVHEEAPSLTGEEDLPSLKDLVLGLVEELAPHVLDLAVHMCGSHVLRTLLCILGGVRLLKDHQGGQRRRGKAKTKKKKKAMADAEAAGGASSEHMVYATQFRIDPFDSFIQDAVKQLTEALSGTEVQPPGELQQLACHSSAGPLLNVLLRVLTYRDAPEKDKARIQLLKNEVSRSADHHLALLKPEPRYNTGSEAHALAQRLLCWQVDKEKQEWAGDVIYGLAGEPRGSHCLETLLRNSPDDVYAAILHTGDFASSSTLQQYVEHEVSNFVIQTLLATLRNEEMGRRIIQALEPVVSSGQVLDPSKKRRGILWRMVESAAKFKLCQDSILKSILAGFAALDGDQTTKGFDHCVPKLLDMRKPERDGDRLVLDVAGTRAIHHILRFEPRLCKATLKGILNLPRDELELLAKDGLGSRCIFDGILEGPVNDPVFATALTQLLANLSGRWVALSVDRVGHHIVKKMFRVLRDMEDKEKLVNELSKGKNRLTGNNMGRSVVEACAVQEYDRMENTEWRRVVKKMLEKEDWLRDIVEGEKQGVGSNKKKRKKRKGDELGTIKKKGRDHAILAK